MKLPGRYDIMYKNDYAYWQEGGETVLNNKKIHVMAKLSIMEKQKDKFVIPNFYMGDYIRFNLMRTVVRVTIGYVLILALVALYNVEFIIANAVTLDYERIGAYAIGIYILLIVVYALGGLIGYAFKYRRAQRYISRYDRGLSLLRKFYQNDSEHK